MELARPILAAAPLFGEFERLHVRAVFDPAVAQLLELGLGSRDGAFDTIGLDLRLKSLAVADIVPVLECAVTRGDLAVAAQALLIELEGRVKEFKGLADVIQTVNSRSIWSAF